MELIPSFSMLIFQESAHHPQRSVDIKNIFDSKDFN